MGTFLSKLKSYVSIQVHMYRYISVYFLNLKDNWHVSMHNSFVSIQKASFSNFLKIHEHISFKTYFYDFLLACMYETHITNKVHSYVCEQNKVPKHIITWEHMLNQICMIKHPHKWIKYQNQSYENVCLFMHTKSHIRTKQTYTNQVWT